MDTRVVLPFEIIRCIAEKNPRAWYLLGALNKDLRQWTKQEKDVAMVRFSQIVAIGNITWTELPNGKIYGKRRITLEDGTIPELAEYINSPRFHALRTRAYLDLDGHT